MKKAEEKKIEADKIAENMTPEERVEAAKKAIEEKNKKRVENNALEEKNAKASAAALEK